MTKEESKKSKGRSGTRGIHKKVFDVVPPGKSVAPPNSRSVIVGHKPPVQDDQFVPGPFGVSEGVTTGATSGGASSRASGAAANSAATQSAAHVRMAGDPSEKHPLLDGRKKLELKPVAGEDEAKPSIEPSVTTDRPTEAAVSAGPNIETDHPAEPQGAPELTGQAAAKTHYESAPGHLADLAVEQTVETEMFDQGEQGGQGSGLNQSGDTLNQSNGEQLAREGTARYGLESAAEGSAGLTDGAANPGADAPDGATPGKHQTVDDILAETGPPDLAPQKAVVSTHHRRIGALQGMLIFLLVLILGVVALNFLLDAEIIETGLDLPHTDLIR